MNDEWSTPHIFFEGIKQEFGPFDLDPCVSDSLYAKAEKYFTPEDDGLKQEWFGHVFVNPPFSDLKGWSQKIIEQMNNPLVKSITLLTPAHKVEQTWFTDILFPYISELYYIKGRLQYETMNGAKMSSPEFPSMLMRFEKSYYFRMGVISRKGKILLVTK